VWKSWSGIVLPLPRNGRTASGYIKYTRACDGELAERGETRSYHYDRSPPMDLMLDAVSKGLLKDLQVVALYNLYRTNRWRKEVRYDRAEGMICRTDTREEASGIIE
jgi:hypothetical protein